MIFEEDDYLMHYGILRKSGRYPWGSGGSQNKRNRDFLDYVAEMRAQGLTDTEIAKGQGITTTLLRESISIARNEQKAADAAMALRLKEKGLSNSEIGRRMDKNESSVRALLAAGVRDKAEVLGATVNALREAVDSKRFIDVGVGVEHHLGISRQKLNTAVAALRSEGYELIKVQVDQFTGAGNKTTVKVLAPPGTKYLDVKKNADQITQAFAYSEDGGRTFARIQPPLVVNSKRVAVRYAEQGGADADGVMYIRPGVKDLSMGSSRYAQVRVAVDGTHYLKGMAMYKDDLPNGVDIVFNTNKSSTGNKLDAMKKMSDDPLNPFGAIVRQIGDPLPGGGKKVTSALNLVNEEGDWQKWAKSLSSQMLSKQTPALAKERLDETFSKKQKELDEILALTNPTVRQKLLEKFADSADSSSIHLKAAALPRSSSHVILPINTLKETEIYAPNFKHGEKVVLIRYPHGGIFEIPELTVNNNHAPAKRLLGSDIKDAVGIHSEVAKKLSGADFDGDTVMVIPNNSRKVKTAPSLEGLKNFDPQKAYPYYEGMKVMSPRTKQIEMGKVSNLITDMTIHRASSTELAAAVRHSMVVIDAEKHKLNYRQSEIDNGIANLKKKYQGPTGGASTLISNSGTSSKIDVPERKRTYDVDPATGRKIPRLTGATYVDKATGKTIAKTSKIAKLASVDDAHVYSSGKTIIEKIYGDHSNRLKSLANQARKEAVNTKTTPYSPSARTAYAQEVASLSRKLKEAVENKPRERQALIIANAQVAARTAANPGMDPAELKKLKSLAIESARLRMGAAKVKIDITPSEWAAIQAGAITNKRLSDILDNMDVEKIKELATPRVKVLMTSGKQARAKSLLASGKTQAEVAELLGVSLTTLKNYV